MPNVRFHLDMNSSSPSPSPFSSKEQRLRYLLLYFLQGDLQSRGSVAVIKSSPLSCRMCESISKARGPCKVVPLVHLREPWACNVLMEKEQAVPVFSTGS